MGDIFFSQFVLRQTPISRFSHWTISNADLLERIVDGWPDQKKGYRTDGGVILVPINPEGFFTNVTTLKSGDRLTGGFESRVPGEEPRKFFSLAHPFVEVVLTDGRKIKVQVDDPPSKPPAKSVDVILYRKDVLEEDHDWVVDTRNVMHLGLTPHDWAIIAVNCHPTGPEVEVPIDPQVLIANHFMLSGGTRTGMDDHQFVEALRVSVDYWKDKIGLG